MVCPWAFRKKPRILTLHSTAPTHSSLPVQRSFLIRCLSESFFLDFSRLLSAGHKLQGFMLSLLHAALANRLQNVCHVNYFVLSGYFIPNHLPHAFPSLSFGFYYYLPFFFFVFLLLVS